MAQGVELAMTTSGFKEKWNTEVNTAVEILRDSGEKIDDETIEKARLHLGGGPTELALGATVIYPLLRNTKFYRTSDFFKGGDIYNWLNEHIEITSLLAGVGGQLSKLIPAAIMAAEEGLSEEEKVKLREAWSSIVGLAPQPFMSGVPLMYRAFVLKMKEHKEDIEAAGGFGIVFLCYMVHKLKGTKGSDRAVKMVYDSAVENREKLTSFFNVLYANGRISDKTYGRVQKVMAAIEKNTDYPKLNRTCFEDRPNDVASQLPWLFKKSKPKPKPKPPLLPPEPEEGEEFGPPPETEEEEDYDPFEDK